MEIMPLLVWLFFLGCRYVLMPCILASVAGTVVLIRWFVRRAHQTENGDSWSVFWSTVTVLISLVHTVMSKAYFSVFDVYPHQVAGHWFVHGWNAGQCA